MKKIGRREATRRALTVLGAAAVAPAALAACGSEDSGGGLTCTDTSSLEPAQAALREQKNYTDSSPNSEETCTLCRFYQPSSAADACGTCRVVQGPIHPDGYCDLFAANG